MRVFLLFCFLQLGAMSFAQSTASSVGNDANMPAMDRSGHGMGSGAQSFIQFLQEHSISGTDAEPASTPSTMLMTTRGNWMFMFHGEVFLNAIQQSGPRGADKVFSTNWFMPMARRRLGHGNLTLRTMLSLEPATVSQRQYPELFQQGETAYGKPIVDGQHPHDFFMELAALYDYPVGEKTLLSLYLAPVGDPALGPPAYPHRESAAEDPIAPISHHLQDSTHIADDVITVGLAHSIFRLEASGFHGREPDEFRWNIDSGAVDSWSTRLTVNPAPNWSAQYSIGQLHSPEQLAPAENVRRMTASVIYNRRLTQGNWATMVAWGRNQSLTDGNVGNGYLLESTLTFHRDSVWTRIENADRTNELLLGENPLSPGFTERYFARVQAYTAGYDREVGHIPHLSMAVGGQIMWYGVPELLTTTYGAHPVGGVAFVRFRVK